MSTNTTIKSSLTSAAGKYLVPAPLANTIWENIQNKSAIIPFLNKMPMSSATLKLNAVDEDLVMSWVDGEGGDKTVSNETYTQVTLTAYELAVIVTITDILIEDANIGMDAHIRGEIEDAVVTALEQSYLGYYDASPFAQTISGDCPDAHTIAYGAGDDLLVDISNALGAIEEDGFEEDIAWAANPTLKSRMRNLRDDDNQPIFQPATGKEPAALYSYPIRFSRNMMSTGSPAARELIVGDWHYAFEGIRGGLRYDITDKATITIGGKPVNLWEHNMKAIKMWIRRAFLIRDVNAFAKVTGL